MRRWTGKPVHFIMEPIILSLPDLLRAGQVKRWHVLPIPPQTVAEHSYNVAMIARYIVHKVYPGKTETSKKLTRQVVEYALLHDASEIITSDIPSPIGHLIGDAVKQVKTRIQEGLGMTGESDEVKFIVKMADIMDALIYVQRYMTDKKDHSDVAGRTFVQLRDRLYKMTATLDAKWNPIIELIGRVRHGGWDNQPTDMLTIWGEEHERSSILDLHSEKAE